MIEKQLWPASHSRLGQEAVTLAELLGKSADAVSQINETGIVSGGFKKEYPCCNCC